MKKKKKQVLNRRVPRVTGSRETLQHRLPMELSNGLNYAQRMLPGASKAGRASTLMWLAMEGLEKVIRDDYHNRALDRRRKAVEQMLNTAWNDIEPETWAMLHAVLHGKGHGIALDDMPDAVVLLAAALYISEQGHYADATNRTNALMKRIREYPDYAQAIPEDTDSIAFASTPNKNKQKEHAMNKTLFFLTVFSLGYVTNDILRENNINLIGEVHAEVDGMDYRDLRRDRDFKKAVEYIIEDFIEYCSVSGYVDGDYLYSSSISC